MNFYQILGVTESATQAEIKQAYRKLAAKHHPDKGGDTTTFQSIAQAYDTLGDETKRAQYHAGMNGDNNSREYRFNNIDEMFSHVFGGANPFGNSFRQPHAPRRKNRDLNIKVTITFKQSYTGADLEASYQTPSGKKETIAINVPAGIQSGQTIRYQGLGDDSDSGVPRGSLHVTIIVEHNQTYERRGNDLLTFVLLHPIEAMIGCNKSVETPDGKQIPIVIKPGVQHGTEHVTKGLGFDNFKGGKGNFVTVIGIEVPAVTDHKLKEKLEQIYAEISLTQR